MFDYAKSETQFIKICLSNGVRLDGRSPVQRRTSQIKRNMLDNLAGSSYVSIDHGKCQIYTGIKLKVTNQHEKKNNSQVFLEISSMRKLSRDENNLLVYIQQLLLTHFIQPESKGFHQLNIPNSKMHSLQMHIQCFILSYPHLSLIEPLYLSIREALLATTIPKIQCIYNEITNEESVELINQTQSPILTALDNLILVGCYQGKHILDLTPLQFQSVDSVFLLTIKDEKIRSVQSLKGSIATENLHKIVKFGIHNSK